MSESAGPTSAPDALLLDRQALLRELRLLLRALRPLSGVEAILSFDGECLHIDLSGATITVPARGRWPGQVRVPASWLTVVAKMPPPGDPLELIVRENSLHLSTLSVACQQQAAWASPIQIPVNADDTVLLAIRLRYSSADIEAAGLRSAVAKAEASRDRAVATAAKALARYGVKDADVSALVDQAIRESGLPGRV